MSGSSVIRIAGIGLQWTEDYAAKYGKVLEEMGFYTKRVLREDEGVEKVYLAYCYRPFSSKELDGAMEDLFN